MSLSMQSTIEAKLRGALAPVHLEVINESHNHSGPPNAESHFKVIVVSEQFIGRSLIEQQRLVNAALSEELKGAVHALSMKTLTPSAGRPRVDRSSTRPALPRRLEALADTFGKARGAAFAGSIGRCRFVRLGLPWPKANENASTQPAIALDEVRRTAELARLNLTPTSSLRTTAELARILTTPASCRRLMLRASSPPSTPCRSTVPCERMRWPDTAIWKPRSAAPRGRIVTSSCPPSLKRATAMTPARGLKMTTPSHSSGPLLPALSGLSAEAQTGLAGLVAAVQGRQVSAREITQAYLSRIAALDPGLGCFLHVAQAGSSAAQGDIDHPQRDALAQAAAVDARIAAGEGASLPLAGVPVGLRTRSARRACPRRRDRASSPAGCRPTTRRWWLGCGRLARSSSAS